MVLPRGRKLTAATTAWLDAPMPQPMPGTTPLLYAQRTVLEEHYKHTTRYKQARGVYADLWCLFPEATLEGLTKVMLRSWVAAMRDRGLKAESINCNLSAVGRMFAHFDMESVIIPYVPHERALKWWLTPEVEEVVIRWMREQGYDDLADYTRWTVLTGLRVMESLRVSRHHFTALATDEASLTVPGTKTRDAQASLPLLPEATTIARNRLGRNYSAPTPTDRLFPVQYVMLQKQWLECRKALGLDGIYGATLKAFRRSFARHATERGLPTDMLRQYLRHEHLETTAGYLRLVGGYSMDTMRQWLR